MTWIRTIPFSEADDELRQAMEAQNRSIRRSTPFPSIPSKAVVP